MFLDVTISLRTFLTFTRGELSGSDLFVDYIKFEMERTDLEARNTSHQINSSKEGMKVGEQKDPEQQTPGEMKVPKDFKTSIDICVLFWVIVRRRFRTLRPRSSTSRGPTSLSCATGKK
jgi:hypothetical protein